MSKSSGAPPASASPPPRLPGGAGPAPQPRGFVGTSRLAERHGQEVVASSPDYEAGRKLQLPAGSGAADGGRREAAGAPRARGGDGTLLELAGLAPGGRSLTPRPAALQSGNPGGGQSLQLVHTF